VREQLDELLTLTKIIRANTEHIMTQQADFDADIATLTTFFTTTLPAGFAAIEAELATMGITNLASLDALANTTVPQTVASLNAIAPLPGTLPGT
jgi:hypothetical protein